jgi:serine/threonine-protein kinase
MISLIARTKQLIIRLIDRPFPEGTRLQGSYVIERVLGMGSYGITYLCRDEQAGRQVVLKQILPSKRYGSKGFPVHRYETELLAELDHPAIPKLLDRFWARGHWFFAMEYMTGRTLEDELFEDGITYSEREALALILSLLDIVEYLHSRGIVHRDIRIPNVIRNGEQLALIDFGLARRIGDPPTLIAEDLHDYAIEKRIKRTVAFSSDFYALGHFLLFLLYSTYRIEHEQAEEKSWEEELTLSPATRRLLRRMLQLDEPYESCVELRAALQATLQQI